MYRSENAVVKITDENTRTADNRSTDSLPGNQLRDSVGIFYQLLKIILIQTKIWILVS